MHYYNQTRTNGIPMPLLMGFTPSTKIKEAEDISPLMYDPVTQTADMDMREVGTKSLKLSQTKLNKPTGGYVSDKKNEIDDRKYVQ